MTQMPCTLTHVQAVCIIFVVPCYMFRPLKAILGQPVKLYVSPFIFTVPFCKHMTLVFTNVTQNPKIYSQHKVMCQAV
jgi:hypothetical protein